MAEINKELKEIKNAVYGQEVRGSIHDGIKKINEETESSTEKAEQAHDVMESIINEGFDNAALEANFEQKLDDKINDLQPEWTGFKDDVTSQLADIATSPLLFGAVGDGVTDDTNAFRLANQVSNKIIVPSGYIFLIDNLDLTNVELFGGGELRWKANSSTKMINFIGTHNVNNIAFNGNSEHQDNVNRVSLSMENAPNSSFDRCKFTNFKSKLIQSDINKSNHTRITSCDFFDTTGLDNGNVIAIRSSGWKVTGNTFKNIGNGHCIRTGLFDGDEVSVVRNTLIEGNSFDTTEHNAITLEIYTEDTIISNNDFNENPQAIKCESEGATVKRVTVDGNNMRNIYLSTALNLSVSDVTFTNNTCRDMGGAPYFGDNYNCSNNKFYNVGKNDTTGYTIGEAKAGVKGTIHNNLIVDAPHDGMRTSNADIRGNIIINPTNDAIRVSGNNLSISDNNIKGAKAGIQLVSSVFNAVITGNVVTDTTTPLLYTSNENFKSVFLSNNVGIHSVLRGTSTLIGGSVSMPSGTDAIRIDTEGTSPSGTLTNILGGEPNQSIVVYGVSSSRTITVGSSGNVRPRGTFTIAGSADNITLMYTGTVWVETSRTSL